MRFWSIIIMVSYFGIRLGVSCTLRMRSRIATGSTPDIRAVVVPESIFPRISMSACEMFFCFNEKFNRGRNAWKDE